MTNASHERAPAYVAPLVFLVTSGAMLVGWWVHRDDPAAVISSGRLATTMLLEIIVGTVLFTLVRVRGRRVVAWLTAPSLDDVVIGVGLYLATIAISLVLVIVSFGVLRSLHMPPMVKRIDIPPTLSVGVVVAVSIINPVFEEYLWLGYWYNSLQQKSPLLAGVVSIGLRALAHLYKGLTGAVLIIPLGLLYTVYYRRTGKLAPVMIAHALTDATALFGGVLLARHH